MEGSDFDGAHRHREPARPGRRRKPAEEQPDEELSSIAPSGGGGGGGPPKKMSGGWGDDGGGGGSGGAAPAPRRRRAAEEENSPPAVEQTRNRHFDDDDGSDDGGLNLIPDLDDEEAEDVTRQVAVAPALKTSRVPTIEELDAEIDLALPSASEIGIDLTALQKFLSPKEQVQEEDVPWDYEHEVGKLASEMQAEIDARADAVAAKAGSPKRA